MSSPSSDSGKSRIDRQLAAAAASVFAEKGFHNSTLEDIAAQVDIDINNIRGYFRSPADALYDVCEYGMHDYVESA
ncbi:MAG: TetR family transcriptional regulator [Bacteroidetes bacterium]|nr:TetR family transcriptional regulator [Bacteroidota bacterium]